MELTCGLRVYASLGVAWNETHEIARYLIPNIPIDRDSPVSRPHSRCGVPLAADDLNKTDEVKSNQKEL